MPFKESVQGLSPAQKVVFSAVPAEMLAIFAAPYAPHLFEKAAPKLRDRLINGVSQRVMLPHMARAESLMENMFRSKVVSGEWAAAKEAGTEAKAQFMGEKFIDLAATFPGSFVTSLVANKLLEQNLMKQPFHFGRFMIGAAIEGGVHVGVMIAGPKLLPDQLGALKSWTCKTLENLGMKHETADSISQSAVYSGIGDGLGFLANVTLRAVWANREARAV